MGHGATHFAHEVLTAAITKGLVMAGPWSSGLLGEASVRTGVWALQPGSLRGRNRRRAWALS